MPLFFGDLLASTQEWPGLARSLYLDLLARQWFSPKHSLPTDPDAICALVGWETGVFEKYWPRVALKYQQVEVDGEGRLQNLRLESHRGRASEISEKRAIAGSKGGTTTAAKLKHLLPGGTANAPDDPAIAPNLLGHPNQTKPSNPDPSSSLFPQEPPPEASADGGVPVEGELSQKRNPCPHERIIELYHQMLPELPRIEEWNPTRRGHLNQRWASVGKRGAPRDNLDYWRKFFEFVRHSDFLMGRVAPQPGRKRFVANLAWMVKPENFAKIIEKQYHHD
jgi:hypothetical protein